MIDKRFGYRQYEFLTAKDLEVAEDCWKAFEFLDDKVLLQDEFEFYMKERKVNFAYSIEKYLKDF